MRYREGESPLNIIVLDQNSGRNSLTGETVSHFCDLGFQIEADFYYQDRTRTANAVKLVLDNDKANIIRLSTARDVLRLLMVDSEYRSLICGEFNDEDDEKEPLEKGVEKSIQEMDGFRWKEVKLVEKLTPFAFKDLLYTFSPDLFENPYYSERTSEAAKLASLSVLVTPDTINEIIIPSVQKQGFHFPSYLRKRFPQLVPFTYPANFSGKRVSDLSARIATKIVGQYADLLEKRRKDRRLNRTHSRSTLYIR